MKLTGKIKSAVRDHIVKSGEEFMEVTFEIMNDGKLMDVKKLGFPVDVTKNEIKKELKKLLQLLTEEMERSEVQQEEEAKNEKADKLAEDLLDLEVKA